MRFKKAVLAAAGAAMATGMLLAVPAAAQAQEQFVPLMVYRTGQFAPLGIPWADGKQDYLKLVNARGGVNGVKISFEECETAYDTAKGVECYERLKAKNGGASGFDTQSTGITFAVSDKAPGDKVPVVTPGYGLSQAADGRVFEWNFPLLGTYWTAADSMIQDILKKEKGSLKGKKIALVYHDSPYGKEPLPLLLTHVPHWLGLSLSTATATYLEHMIFGALIVFFLIVEPHGLAKLWATARQKLRLWPFPH